MRHSDQELCSFLFVVFLRLVCVLGCPSFDHFDLDMLAITIYMYYYLLLYICIIIEVVYWLFVHYILCITS